MSANKQKPTQSRLDGFTKISSNTNMPCIGIDLGTTNSCVGVYNRYKNGVDIIANNLGERTTPSTVDNELIVGNPGVYSVKRLIGRSYDQIQHDLKLLTYPVTEVDGQVYITIADHQYTPVEISALILRKMRSIAEEYLNTEIKDAVITVPAYFNDRQRQATCDAGVLAGLNILRIINEPTAAALAYGLDKHGERVVLIYDLGGGTLDVSVLSIDDGLFSVIATNGDTHLGGDDFDNKIITWCLKEFKRQYPTLTTQEIVTNQKILSKLKRASEQAKRALSTQQTVNIDVEALYNGLDFHVELTRSKFENLCSALFQRCITPIENVLNDAKLHKDQIDDIVFVGGSTRIPWFTTMIQNYFGKQPHCEINPDEAIAYGAAVQGGVLTNEEQLCTITLVDITSLSLGVEIAGGVMSVITPRNTPTPITTKKTFSTYSDNQPSVLVNVYEGENSLVADNNLLGGFEIFIDPAPRGVPKIDVIFNVDTNNILHVTAESSGQKRSITVKRIGISTTQPEIETPPAVKLIKRRREFEKYLLSIQDRFNDLAHTESERIALQSALANGFSVLANRQITDFEDAKRLLERATLQPSTVNPHTVMVPI